MKDLIAQAQKHYRALPKEIFCPAFSEFVKVTRAGYNHLIKDKERSELEIKQRLNCLPCILPLLQKSRLLQDHEYKYTKSGRIDFYTIQGVLHQKTIRIVMRKIGSQSTHLYSVVFKGKAPRRKRQKQKRF